MEDVLKMLHAVYAEKEDIMCFAGEQDIMVKHDEALADMTARMKPIFDKLMEDTKQLGIDLEVKLILKLK